MKLEKGLSVFRGYRAEDGDGYVVDTATPSQAAMWLLVAYEARDVYLATGREIALGSDMEPVLADVELVPLPPGTLVRSSERWRRTGCVATALKHPDPVSSFLALWKIPQEVRVGEGPPPPDTPESLAALARAVLARARLANSSTHGERHWRRVAAAGARICEEAPGSLVDPLVVLLFAALHDSQRLNNGLDLWHGWRAARLARWLLEGSGLVSDTQLDTLTYALEVHDEGLVSDDPTVGACWDADRLCLWREGTRPDPRLLSTEAARRPETIAWAGALHNTHLSWHAVCEGLGLTGPEHLAMAEVLDAGPVLDGTRNATIEDMVHAQLRRWGTAATNEEIERSLRMFGFGATMKQGRGREA